MAVTLGSAFRLKTRIVGPQERPAVAILSDDGFVVTWTSADQDGSGVGIYGRRFYGTGSRVGAEFRVNSCTANDQRQPAVSSLADGGFVVT